MQIPEIVRNVLRSGAPTLLSALSLPPPLNGIAVRVAASALGRLDRDAGGAGGHPTTADEAIGIISRNAGDPEIFAKLREAERELKRYEGEAGVRFAELAVEDRERASELHTRGRIAETAYRHGMQIVWIAIGSILLILLASLWVAMNGVPERDAQYMVAAFGLIGTAVGFINGIAGSIVTFYYGSSQGSKDKSDSMADSLRRFGDELGRAAERGRAAETRAEAVLEEHRRLEPRLPAPAAPATAPVPPARETESEAEALAEAKEDAAFPPREGPASLGLLADLLPELTRPHRHFDTSARWHLTAGGLSVDGAPAARTPGTPRTVAEIWSRYGDDCADAAVRFGVPVELIVATIATESGGDPDARRAEPHLGTESVGLMQTLITTAREALGKRAISGDDLLEPAMSIAAGAAYISQQRKSTHFDPPLVAASYNAGSLRRDPAPGNRWKLVCYPAGTGAHIDRFAAWFGDAMVVSAEADWCRQGRVPSFAAASSGGDAAPAEEGAASPALADPVSLTELAEDTALATRMQEHLSRLGYLDPPPDGRFGPISTWALETFCSHRAIVIGSQVTPEIVRAMEAPDGALPVPSACRDHPWLDRAVARMAEAGHWICRVPHCRNILYIEGADLDGTPNDDRPDAFNDLRVVFWAEAGGRMQARVWQATTEPGRHFTDRPLNAAGAARIGFGQYKAWRVGTHRAGSKSAHEALVQVSDVDVHRDLDKNHARAGDRVQTGLFGINQHWGYDRPEDDIGTASAGCLVGRSVAGHREFMAEIKRDPRYLANPDYRFVTTILPARDVLE